MSNRYKGGVISATPPTTTGGNDGVASGAWTLEQQMQAQAAGLWPNQPVFYIEDVFSTYLYTGNGSTQTITNGIDLSGKGGLLWLKARSTSGEHALFDTTRGTGTILNTDSTNQARSETGLASFNTDGFSFANAGSTVAINFNGRTFASWSFEKAPKFFDVVTYTGNGVSGRTIASNHNMGSGFLGAVFVKRTDTTSNWKASFRGGQGGQIPWLSLNLSINDSYDAWVGGNVDPGINGFSVSAYEGNISAVNAVGGTYVAYLFAHNAGGFGLSGTDNVITCGSYVGNGSATGPVIDIGWEPQWVLTKRSTGGTGNWIIFDNMRGLSLTDAARLQPNGGNAESSSTFIAPTSTGFQVTSTDQDININNSTYVYMAIRRGPMRVPTSGTSVFQPIIDTGDTIETSTATFPLDMQFNTLYNVSNATYNNQINDRLRGIGFAPSFTTTPHLTTASTAAETTSSSYLAFKGNGMDVTKDTGWGGTSAVFYNFKRAPSFFDEVCYTGTGVANTAFTHNLTVTPELMIVKPRSAATAPNWRVWSPINSTDFNLLQLSTDGAASSSLYSSSNVFPAIPTATTFTVGGSGSIQLNQSGQTFVAYLFSTCAGVSKVGSYTGTGALQTVNCGFAAGARFILIKRTDSTGDWYVYDSTRGITSGNDPYLLWNTTGAEVTGTDYINTTGVGFQVTATAPAGLNANGGTYIFLAIA